MPFNDPNILNISDTSGLTGVREKVRLYSGGLAEREQTLKAELDKIHDARAKVVKQFETTMRGFLAANVKAVGDDNFQRLDEISLRVGSVGEPLSAVAADVKDVSDHALGRLNKVLGKTLTADQVQRAATNAARDQADAREDLTAAQSAAAVASRAVTEWQTQNPVAAQLVALDAQVRTETGKGLVENRRTYEKTSFFGGIVSSISHDTPSQVRAALKAYGHGKDGKDAFADLEGFKTASKTLLQAAAQAIEAAAAAETAVKAADAAVAQFAKASVIKNDAQILAAVFDKAVEYFGNKEFAAAVTKEFGEDFPREAAFLTVKLENMDKLCEGVEAKISQVEEDRKDADKKYRGLSRMKALPPGFDSAAADNYTKAHLLDLDNRIAAIQQNQQRLGSYQMPSTVVGYSVVDPFDAYLASYNQMLMIDMLVDMESRDQFYDNQVFVPDANAFYTQQLFGMSPEIVSGWGIAPEVVFEPSPVIVEQMNGFGIDNYTSGSFGGNDAGWDNNPDLDTNGAFDNPWDTLDNNAPSGNDGGWDGGSAQPGSDWGQNSSDNSGWQDNTPAPDNSDWQSPPDTSGGGGTDWTQPDDSSGGGGWDNSGDSGGGGWISSRPDADTARGRRTPKFSL